MDIKVIFPITSYTDQPYLLHNGYVSSLLTQNQIEHEFYDCSSKTRTQTFINKIKQQERSLLCFVSSLFNPCCNVWLEKEKYELIEIIKNQVPKEKYTIIADGIFSTELPEKSIQKGIDIAITGESDFVFLDLIKKITRNQEWKTTGQIIYKENGKIIKTPLSKEFSDINKLPLPNRDFFKNRIDKDMIDIIVSRGCNFHCTICQPISKRLYGRPMRYRSHESVLNELKRLAKDQWIGTETVVDFHSDTLSANREWLIQLCDSLIKEKIKINWRATVRFDRVDEELISIMRNAGCGQVDPGIEAISEKARNKIINKQITNEQIKNGIKLFKKYNIEFYTDFIIGIPDSFVKELFLKILFIIRYRPKALTLSTLIPVPGTALFKIAEKKGLLKSSAYDPLSYDQKLLVKNVSFYKNVSNIRVQFERNTIYLILIIISPVFLYKKIKSRINKAIKKTP